MMIPIHRAVSALALFQGTQLNLFERFLTQAVSGIDSTSITSGMQNIAYVVLLIGFLWQVYQSALHGGDVRGLGTSLIKYVATAVVVMNYHAVFTTINQGFVNGGNWISNASGAGSLFENWASDVQTQFNQVGYQKLWGLVTADMPGLIDAILIIVAYVLYPVVIVIFGFFYMLYGSILYIFGPIVVSLMPLGATNRIAKAYVENVFIWNSWPILYGGFGALLSAVQMGQIGQMLNQNNFLGGLGNLEGSVLIGLASIIYSLAIAVIPFIAKRVVSGDVGSTAAALVGAATTALTAGVAAGEGVIAGAAAAKASTPGGGLASGQGSGRSALSGTTARMSGTTNQPAPQQRTSTSTATSPNGTTSRTSNGNSPASSSTGTGTTQTPAAAPSLAEAHAQQMREAAGAERPSVRPQSSTSSQSSAATASRTPSASGSSTGSPSRPSSPRSGQGGAGANRNRPSVAPYRLSTWAAYHAARMTTQGAMTTGSNAFHAASDFIAHPGQFAGRTIGGFAGNVVNAADRVAGVGASVVNAVSNPVSTARQGYEAASGTVRSASSRIVQGAVREAQSAHTEFDKSFKETRDRAN